VNFVDLIVLVLLVGAAVRGWQRGLMGQVFELGGGFIGLLAGIAIGPRLAAALTEGPGLAGALISLVVVLVCLSLGQTAGFILGHRFGIAAHRARLGPVNQALGGGFGLLVTLIAVWLLGSLLVQGPLRPLARAVGRSEIVQGLNATLPDPPSVLAYIGQYLRTSGFPQVFAGLPRPVGPPVKLPPGGAARRAAEAAGDSTVRVVAEGCGGLQLGSGWVADEDSVVTNAHVVAGSSSITIQDTSGDHIATVVLYDPRTDVAVVTAGDLAGPPLELNESRLPRGTGGATLGFPGGGGLVVHRAAISAQHQARGLDIYGRRQVTRSVYELRAPVRQGDSGGPFVLPTGDVGGLIFAASTTDGDTGYALTGAEIADEVAGGSAAEDGVDTGSCTH
jgi:S1-C subfamily serine protease/uncharacterized membrane protein required for colicin V production